MKKRRIVIVSVDALNSLDYEYLKTLPTFSEIIKHGSTVVDVKSIYPSLTYPAHTSISTGVYPDKHGIFNNEVADPSKPLTQDWYWHKKDIKAKTMFDYALENGYKVGAILWPVMANSGIHYNLPEIYSPDNSESFTKLFLKNGTWNLIPTALKNIKLLDGIKQPNLDDFAEKITLHTLKKTNFTAIHYTILDSWRHYHGLNSQEAKEALKIIDKKLHRILKLIKKIGEFKNTTFAILGDHGMHTYNKVIEANSFFRKNGILETDNDYNIIKYKAYAVSCGGSCHIHLNKNNSNSDNKKVYEFLKEFEKEDCISRLFTKEKSKKLFHLDGDFDYILEANNNHAFRNTISEEFVRDVKFDVYHYHGAHGYLPTHPELKTMLLMVGKGIKRNHKINGDCIVDFGPTIMHSIGIEMKDVDGKVLDVFE